MNGQVFVVTGGNTGIGKAIAMELAKQKARVVIISRDYMKGLTALEDIRLESDNMNVEVVTGDLSTIDGCRKLAACIQEKYPDIHALINNAGIWKTDLEINKDGLEMTFMVNHMAPFILTSLLLNRLKNNAPSRIVNVNAGLFVKGKVDLEKTPYGKDFSKFGTYPNTKLCNVLFTCELARLLEGSGVTVNAVHPGVIRTNLGGDTKGVFGIILNIAKRFWASPEQGAKAPVWLAADPELQNTSGKYFLEKKEFELPAAAKDNAMACRLWELSANLAGI